MASPWKQTIAMYISSYISKSKGNNTMKCEYNDNTMK